MVRLTEPTFRYNRFSYVARFTRTSLVDCADTKFVLSALFQTGHRSGRDVHVVYNFSFHPFFTEFLFVFDYVASDGSATVVVRFCPLEIRVIFVPISNLYILGFTRFA